MINYALLAIIALQSALHYWDRQRLLDQLLGEKPASEPPKRDKGILTAHQRAIKRWREGDKA